MSNQAFSEIDYELYFMSGKPIDLNHKSLGVVYQPTLGDLVDNKMDLHYFSHPFLFDKDMISNKKDTIDELVKDLGRLGFLIIYSEITKMSSGDATAIDLLSSALKLLYRTDNVMVVKTISKIVVDGTIVIGDSELDFLSDLVVEMLRIDREEMKRRIAEKNKEVEQDALMSEFDRRAKAYENKQSKRKEFTFMDMVNVVVHSQDVIDYRRVFDMTIYQIRNSYETLIKKESFTISLMHRISPNFKPSDDLKLWEENAHIVKSSLNPKD